MGIHEKFFLIEDDNRDALDAFEELKCEGHELVQYAGSFKDAVEGISIARKRGMTVAIVDGNLDHYPDDCEDGRAIAKLIKDQAPDVTVVAYSRSPEEIANFGDIYVSKSPRKLAEAVTAIPRSQK